MAPKGEGLAPQSSRGKESRRRVRKRVSSTSSQLQDYIELFKASFNRKKRSSPPQIPREANPYRARKPEKNSIKEAMTVLNDMKSTISVDKYLISSTHFADETMRQLFKCYLDDVRREWLHHLVHP
ncbi:hypothetical protein CDL15_Pgr015995 [Punica granatum]|uniref:Uncharacterized protein n=1 Tax=Punica granatum TaxID=22663 RepID=A0A218XQM9_PUNGR|nr:hypothetical protein CDL15_Pgr015995 [Punica granatum]